MGRKIGAVLAGALVVGVVVFLLQWIGSRLYPLPPGLDPMDPANRDAFVAHLARMPPIGWALAFGSELLGAFLGAWTAGRIAGSHRAWFAGGIVGLAVMGSFVNWIAFPHPGWFIAGQVVGYPLVMLAALRLLGREPAQEPRAAKSKPTR